MNPASSRRGRPKGGGRDHEQSRAALVQAATTCFLRDGFKSVTIEAIASEAGVSRSIFYRHFADRDEILTIVLVRLSDEYIAQLSKQLAPDEPLADYIVETMAQLVELVRSDPRLIELFADDSRSATGTLVGRSRQLRDRSAAFVSTVLANASPAQISQLRRGLEADAIANHLVLVGLALIQGYEPVSDHPVRLRRYLRDFVVPPLLEPA